MTENSRVHIYGGCSCGAFSFEATGAPVSRFICHCRFCQNFTGAAFSDVSVFLSRSVKTNGASGLAWRKYRRVPNLARGRCVRCGEAAFETMGFWPLKLSFIPSASVSEPSLLPEPRFHVFYNRRVLDAEDALSKHEGYWPSEIAIVKSLVGL